jgi:hypothetical protein
VHFVFRVSSAIYSSYSYLKYDITDGDTLTREGLVLFILTMCGTIRNRLYEATLFGKFGTWNASAEMAKMASA